MERQTRPDVTRGTDEVEREAIKVFLRLKTDKKKEDKRCSATPSRRKDS